MKKIEKGQILNERYRLIERIGSGGFSVVWKALDETSGKEIAIKIFLPEKGADPSLIKMFKEEYELTKHIEHPRLLTAKEYFIYQDSPCLVMPLFAGGNLYEKIRSSGNLEETEIAKILSHISDGLNYLHSLPQPIVHLDIKPENILIDNKGNYALADFGISMSMRSSLIRASNFKGETFQYSAPEKFDSRKVGTKADIFALGVLIYELCCGDVPWAGMGGRAFEAGLTYPDLPEEYNKRLNHLMQACMNQMPQNRPDAIFVHQITSSFYANKYWNDIPYKVLQPQKKTVLSGGLEGTGSFTPPNKSKSKLIWLVIFVVLAVGGYFGYKQYEKVKFEKLQAEIKECCLMDERRFIVQDIDYETENKINQEVKKTLSSIDDLELLRAYYAGEKNKLRNLSFPDISAYYIPQYMMNNDAFLVKLILESVTMNSHSEKQKWFNLYPNMKDHQINNLYDILTREKQKVAEIQIRYFSNQFSIWTKELSEKHQYELLLDLNSKLGNTANIAWYSLLSGRFEEGIRFSQKALDDSENYSDEYYVNKYNNAIGKMLAGKYKESYNIYYELLQDMNEVSTRAFEESVKDIKHFIEYSNYEFNRHFANLLLGLHYYYGNNHLEDKGDYKKHIKCFVLTHDKNNTVQKEIADEVKNKYLK